MLAKILLYVSIFLLGFFSCMLLDFTITEKPLIIGGMSIVNGNPESPSNWVDEGSIKVYDNAVVIEVNGASISRYAPTGSMKPLLDEESNGIRIVPENPSQVEIGDIITFEQNSQLIIHRVIDKGNDEEGAYFITKGDNNSVTDGKIRFKDVRYVTIGVIW